MTKEKMAKFKVGDRVKVIACSGCRECLGKKGTISKTTYEIKFDCNYKPSHVNMYKASELVLLSKKRGRPPKISKSKDKPKSPSSQFTAEKTSEFIKNTIKIITAKVIVDILMGFSKDTDEQTALLKQIIDDIETETQKQNEQNP